MWNLTHRYQAWRWRVMLTTIVLFGSGLAACSGPSSNNIVANRTEAPANVSTDVSADRSPSMQLSPDSGYGGLYVEVSGAHWPPNMMIVVRLEDEQGRSETLAATDTDLTGILSTGFLYPIDERWLDAVPRRVVVTTADGRTETKAEFAVVPPGTQREAVASRTDPPLTKVAIANSAVLTHMVALPIVHAQRGLNDQASVVATDGTIVQILIGSGNASKSFDCNNDQEIFSIAILTTDDFNAASVDPGTVTVSGGESGTPLGTTGTGSNLPVALDLQPSALGLKVGAQDEQNPTRVSQNWGNYTWRWNVADVDSDGDFDLVIEYKQKHLKLTCDATAVTITGRTKNGHSFTGVNQVKMAGSIRG